MINGDKIMENKVIITLAVTGSVSDKKKYPALPVTPKEIAKSAVKAHTSGAAVAHIHVRDPETAEPSMDLSLYREVVERIHDTSDMIISLTCGAGARLLPDNSDPVRLGPGSIWRSPKKRTEHVVALKPELCSLDMGSINFGNWVFANSMNHLEEMSKIIEKAGVKPELEVFDVGHITIVDSFLKKGLLKSPPIVQLCLGIPWGMPATPYNMIRMKEYLPKDSIWGAFGVGPASFQMVAQSALIGGNVRVGFEDNFYLTRGVPADSNAQLVEKTVRILDCLDKEPANPSEAREILEL